MSSETKRWIKFRINESSWGSGKCYFATRFRNTYLCILLTGTMHIPLMHCVANRKWFPNENARKKSKKNLKKEKKLWKNLILKYTFEMCETSKWMVCSQLTRDEWRSLSKETRKIVSLPSTEIVRTCLHSSKGSRCALRKSRATFFHPTSKTHFISLKTFCLKSVAFGVCVLCMCVCVFFFQSSSLFSPPFCWFVMWASCEELALHFHIHIVLVLKEQKLIGKESFVVHTQTNTVHFYLSALSLHVARHSASAIFK